MPVEPFTQTFIVRSYEVGPDKRLTIQNLCNFMQEAAGLHAEELGVGIERLQAESLTWVLSRMRIDPVSMPGPGEAITVTTWPVSVHGLQFRRDFRVTHPDGRPAAFATTSWVVFDIMTRRLVRIPDFIRAIALDNPETALQDDSPKLPDTGHEHTVYRVRARLADMDRNRHVNNVRYVDWVFEGLWGEGGQAPLLDREELRSLDISFRAESFPGDRIAIRSRKSRDDGEVLLHHELVREDDGRELVRARTLWTSAKEEIV